MYILKLTYHLLIFSGDDCVPGQKDVEEKYRVHTQKFLLFSSLLVRLAQHISHNYHAGDQGPDEAQQDENEVDKGGGGVGQQRDDETKESQGDHAVTDDTDGLEDGAEWGGGYPYFPRSRQLRLARKEPIQNMRKTLAKLS